MKFINSSLMLLSLIFGTSLIYAGNAYAFICYSDGVSSGDNTSATFTKVISVSPTTLTKSSQNEIVLTNMASYASCYGSNGSYWKDSLTAKELTVSSSLTALGYTGYISYNGGTKQTIPPDLCLWPDQNCSNTGSILEPDKSLPLKATIGIIRAQNSGQWRSATTIKAGTEIARLVTKTYSNNRSSATITWIFKLQNDLNLTAYTCSIDYFDKSVTLPPVKKSDIQSKGIGRYTGTMKEFKFDLTCDPQTTASIKYEGAPLGSTTNVLKNSNSGNDNVGVQLLFNGSPVEVVSSAPPMIIITNAQNKETLKFNAYYYYNGGKIEAGPIKALATFTFDYY